jgi:hypothetical protein
MKTTNIYLWKLPTSTYLRATCHTDSLETVVLPSTDASRYHKLLYRCTKCLYLGPMFVFFSTCSTSPSSSCTPHYIPNYSSSLDLCSYECWHFSDKLCYDEATEMSPTDVWMTAPEASPSLPSALLYRHTWSVSIIPKCLALLKALMWRTVGLPTYREWNVVVSLEGNIGNYDGGGSVRVWGRCCMLSLVSVISTDALDWWGSGKPHNGHTDKARIAVIRTPNESSFRVANIDTSMRA